MALYSYITDNPRYVTTAGFGCIFNNYGMGPGTPKEPTIVTKFFGISDDHHAKNYNEEKVSHINIVEKCGNFPTMSSIFGIDLSPFEATLVRGYSVPNTVKSGNGGIVTKSIRAGYEDVSPSLICETPNHNGNKLSNFTYSVKKDGVQKYPVIKMNNLGVDLFENPTNLNFNSFIQTLELLALLHTGMIHNDIKGNNMLVSPLTKRVSLIDFGLCTPFKASDPKPPYAKRTVPYLQRSWYAYPPEYTFLRASGNEFRDPSEFPEYTEGFLDEYDVGNLRYKWANNYFLNQKMGETSIVRSTRVRNALHKVYKEYFDPSVGIPNPKIFLQTAVTGDMYTIGLEHAYIYGKISRGNDLFGTYDRRTVLVGSNEITANIFLDRICILLTSLNPRYRPFHINILKLFKHYNRNFIEGATTFVVYGEDTQYMELSILNGNPSTIKVSSEMALGSPDCPVDSTEVINNLKLLYYLVQKDDNYIRKTIYDNNISYAQLLDTANVFLGTNPSSLFPGSYTRNSNTNVRNPLSGVNVPAMPANAPAMSTGLVMQRNPLRPVGNVAPTGLVMKRNPLRNLKQGNHIKVDAGLFSESDRHKKLSGGALSSLYICNETDGIFIKNLIQSGILAIGVYMSVSPEVIIKLIEKQEGGRVAVLQPVNNLFNKNRINKTARLNRSAENNKFLKKLNNKKVSIKVNSNTRTKMSDVPIYSDLQTECFVNEISTSMVGGKINLLYAHYISFLTIENQKELLNLLLFISLSDPGIIRNIIRYFTANSYTALTDYLNTLKTNNVSKLGTDLTMADTKISEIVDKYLSSDDKYTFLLDTMMNA